MCELIDVLTREEGGEALLSLVTTNTTIIEVRESPIVFCFFFCCAAQCTFVCICLTRWAVIAMISAEKPT